MTGANWSSPWDDSDDSDDLGDSDDSDDSDDCSNVSTIASLSWDSWSKRESRTTGSRVAQRRQNQLLHFHLASQHPLIPELLDQEVKQNCRIESFTKETDWSSDWGRKCFLINAPQSSSLL